MATVTVSPSGIASSSAVSTGLSVSLAIPTPCDTSHLRCLVSTNNYQCFTWKFFYPDCTNHNLGCQKAANGAYVSAITVCTQNL